MYSLTPGNQFDIAAVVYEPVSQMYKYILPDLTCTMIGIWSNFELLQISVPYRLIFWTR